jgi:hypothetical protein
MLHALVVPLDRHVRLSTTPEAVADHARDQVGAARLITQRCRSVETLTRSAGAAKTSKAGQ